MSSKAPLFLLAAVLFFGPSVEAGEIVKRTYTSADGKTVSGYVYKSGSSKRSRSGYTRSRSARTYPAYRSHGYVGVRGGYYTRSRSGYGCRTSRPSVRTTRTNITYNAACPITIGSRHRGGVTVYRHR